MTKWRDQLATVTDIESVVREWFARLATGNIDRSQLGAEFAAYLTPARIEGTRAPLAALGDIVSIQAQRKRERGGLEVSTCTVTCRQGAAETLMYRHPSGRIEQFFVLRP